MVRTRWLLPLAIVAIIAGVIFVYREQGRLLRRQSPAKPDALSTDLRSSADHWHWEQTEGTPPFRKTVEITARSFKQTKETSRVDLEEMELKLYHKDGKGFDLVKSPAASFSADDRQLYSEGEVEIVLASPKVTIRTSGVRFDSATGRAETDRPAEFVFEHGKGKSVGAIYDPTVHALEMKSAVEIEWRSSTGRPMKIEAAVLQYYEATEEIWLRQWGKLTRGPAVMEGENSVIHLKEGAVDRVESQRARGVNADPRRRVEYQAEKLWVNFNEWGQVAKVIGETAAKLVSDSAASRTTVRAHRVEMDFRGGEEEEDSTLERVLAAGAGELEATPKPVKGRIPPETQVLRSDRIELAMRAGGEEVERVATQSPGTLDFLPNHPSQRKRRLEGSRLTAVYGPENRIRSFRAVDARTRTEPTAEEKKRNRGVANTASKELAAAFDPQTDRMAALEQWGAFTYEEGDRKARAEKATLDSAGGSMRLETGAHVWDPGGSTAADRILLDERSGDFTAEGRVKSSRVGEKQGKTPAAQSAVGEMLTGEEPLHGLAERMDSTRRNRHIVYSGKATLWQGANRIQGDRVTIDREKRTLVAEGSVVSQLWEKPKPEAKGKKAPAAPLLTVVRARHMVYSDATRLAHYTGDVRMTRPGLDVKGRELRAWMAPSGAESSLERAEADGKVEIVQAERGRTRTGHGEHAEYYTADQKIVLRGGEPSLVDSVRGRTRGAELTYFANDDRLLVNGVPGQPAKSVIRKQ